jgi:hypothetical protein
VKGCACALQSVSVHPDPRPFLFLPSHVARVQRHHTAGSPPQRLQVSCLYSFVVSGLCINQLSLLSAADASSAMPTKGVLTRCAGRAAVACRHAATVAVRADLTDDAPPTPPQPLTCRRCTFHADFVRDVADGGGDVCGGRDLRNLRVHAAAQPASIDSCASTPLFPYGKGLVCSSDVPLGVCDVTCANAPLLVIYMQRAHHSRCCRRGVSCGRAIRCTTACRVASS